jgi:cysteine desulfurase
LIYFDHNATTPAHREVVDGMVPFLRAGGNPASRHAAGREALSALEEARSRVAALLGCDAGEVIFTSGGTEANNLALLGAVDAAGRGGGHVVVSAVEHHAVLEAARRLEEQGVEVTRVAPERDGRVSAPAMAAAVREETCLVSLMLANNETGIVQPVAELARLLAGRPVRLHTDAVQALGRIPVDAAALGVDLLALSGHKFGGPPGVGALVARGGISLRPRQVGGGQEGGLRAGTHNLPAIAGLGIAARLASRGLAEDAAYVDALRGRLEEGLRGIVPEVRIVGAGVPRLPNTTLALFPGADGVALAANLDLAGVAVSTGAACTMGRDEPSHALLAMGFSPEEARGAVRFSLGVDNTMEEIDLALERLAGILGRPPGRGVGAAVRRLMSRR